MWEILVIPAIDDQPVGRQMVFSHQVLDGGDKVRDERVSRFEVRKRTNILFREDDNVKRMGGFRVMESQQCIRLV